MELGLHIANFTWDGGPPELGGSLARLAGSVDEAGFGAITVMDHVWQIPGVGPPEHEMLEAYTTLGYLAAHTRRVRLHTLVTGVTYRAPGLLAKVVTTLDVLSGGRAMLGIGAAWNEEEATGLGLDFAPTAERFERLEETLQICRQMWSATDAPYEGTHYKLGRTLNAPASISKPHPRIMVGGAGERKTLRLVATYADACNLAPGPEVPRKLDVLRDHCEAVGRDYDSIEKTATMPVDLSNGPDAFLEQLRPLHDLGFSTAYLMVPGPRPLETVEVLGASVIPEIGGW